MTTLVTGGTGFLGRHLVERLVARGESVRVLSRRVDLELADLGVEIIEGSMDEAQDIRRAIDGAERVYHLAGRVERDPEHAHVMYELHVEGTRRLLDALREQPVEKIVYASTSGTIGISKDSHTIATDDSDTVEHIAHRWPYYLSKIYAERVVQRFVDAHEMPIVTMRPSLLLGPGDRQESSTGDIIDFLGRKIPTTPSGGIAFVDVRDAADAFILAMDQARPGSSYLVNTCNLTLEDLFQRLEDLSGVRAPRLQLPEKTVLAGMKFLGQAMKALGMESGVDPVSVDMARHFWYVDASRAKRELGWSPRSSNDTLRDTIKYIRATRPELDPEAHLDRRLPPAEFVPEETLAFLRELQKYPEP